MNFLINRIFNTTLKLLICSLISLFLNCFLNAAQVPNVWDVLRNEFKLNHEVNRPEVQAQIRWIQKHPGFVIKVCEKGEPYFYHIIRRIQAKNLPGELALLPMIESAYDPFAYSKAGAAGLWQLMPLTANQYKINQDWWVDGRRSINQSTEAALTHLTHLNKVFKGNWVLSIAAYDAGEGAISRAAKTFDPSGNPVSFWDLVVPQETQAYVPRFLALAEVMSNPEAYNIQLPNLPYRPFFEVVNIGSQIDLNHAARLAGITYKELIKLNPSYNRWATAPYAPFNLLIPVEKVTPFYFNLARFPRDKRVSWDKHIVSPRDSLQGIANQYHTTVNLIKQLNQLSDNDIRPNQILLIPGSKNTPVLPFHEVSKAKFLNITPIKSKEYKVIHIVQARETYKGIGQLYKVALSDILFWNHLEPNATLVKGQQLVIWKKVKQAKTI